MNLTYRSNAMVEDLQPGECTIRRVGDKLMENEWWHLWFYVPRDDNGELDVFAVSVNPQGTYQEQGVGGRTWGLNRTSPGTWQISPSINVLGDQTVVAGIHPAPSIWHQTPTIVGVPDGEKWQS